MFHAQIAYVSDFSDREADDGVFLRYLRSLAGFFWRRVLFPIRGHASTVRSKYARLQCPFLEEHPVRPHEHVVFVRYVFCLPVYVIRHAAILKENVLESTLPFVFC